MIASRIRSAVPPQSRFRVLLCSLVLIVAAGAAPAQPQAPAPSGAEPPPGLTPEQIEQLETLRQKRAELMEVKQRLDQIQKDVMDADPELRSLEDAFAEVLKDEMTRMGRKPDEEVAELRVLQERLQGEELPDAERQVLWGEFQEKAGSFQAAQRQALQSPRVREAQTELRDAIVAAMQARDPETEALLARMESVREELKAMHQRAMGGHAGMGGHP
jgi:AcrR family transcriptional regulator